MFGFAFIIAFSQVSSLLCDFSMCHYEQDEDGWVIKDVDIPANHRSPSPPTSSLSVVRQYIRL